MALRLALDRADLAERVEVAIAAALDQGLRTADIYDGSGTKVSTVQMADAIIAALDNAPN